MKRGSGFLTIGLFAVAATLLSFSVVGSSRAALNYYSDTYGAEVSMQDIGVTLAENGTAVSSRDFSDSTSSWVGNVNGDLTGGITNFRLGQTYDEVLTVRNSGTIDQYVRVTIRKYWQDASGKRTDLDPDLITLKLANTGVWREDTSAGSRERTVLYYDGQFDGYGEGVLPGGQETEAFLDAIVIEDEPIEAEVTQERTETPQGTLIRNVYTYDGVEFVLDVSVDAVQTHNGEQAIPSAWGVDMGKITG